jgi:deoxyribodipyrimidine photo-lyase
LKDWELLPTKPNWAKGFENLLQPGEEGVQKKFKEFIKHVNDYNSIRNNLDKQGTSQISPHLLVKFRHQIGKC